MSTIADTVGDTVIVVYEFDAIPVGATFQMQWRTSPTATSTVVDVTGVVDGTTVSFTISSTESRALGAGKWSYDAQRSVAGSPPIVNTFDKGDARLSMDVTR